MNHALIILCGGGSTRMGTDKALLPFGEVSLLEYLVNKYKPHFSHIYLSVKKPGEYTPVTPRHRNCRSVHERRPDVRRIFRSLHDG